MHGLELRGGTHIDHHEVLVLGDPGWQGFRGKCGNGGDGEGEVMVASRKGSLVDTPPSIADTPGGMQNTLGGIRLRQDTTTFGDFMELDPTQN